MDWKAEWNELLIAENILVRYKRMSDRQQQLDFLQYQKKNISGKLSQIFYKLWEFHVYGKDKCEWLDLHRDIYLAHKMIQKGESWNLKQWEYLEQRIQQKEPFHTVWGETFYEILHKKIKQEKKAEKKSKRRKERKIIRKQEQKDTNSKGVLSNTVAAAVLGLVSLAFLSVWLVKTIQSDQSRYRLEDELARIEQLQDARNAAEAQAGNRGSKGFAPLGEAAMVSGTAITGGAAVTSASAVSDGAIGKKEWKVLEAYQPFLEEHPALYGWLKVEGTSIDLPVMRPLKKMEADFYLHHSFEGEDNTEGTLFVDRECKLKPRSQNIVVYGHNMRNGEMFGGLVQYENPEFLSSHRQITFDTIYEQGLYEIIAVLLTRVLNEDEQGFRYYQLFDFKKAQDYVSCQEFINQNLAYGDPVELKEGEELLMLSTCEYSQENGRLVVVAKRREIE